MRAAAAAQPATAARRTNEALRLLGWPGEPAVPDLAARLLITLAHAEAEQGRTEQGLALLDRAEAFADPADLGTVLQQRGLLLLRSGHIDAALKLLDAAVPVLGQHGDPAILARTLLNRAVLHLAAGRVRLARTDLLACQEVAVAQGLDVLAAKVTHNLGCCELAAGDVPAALHAFDTAATSLRALQADGLLAISMLDRARALLSAGLDAEAGAELDLAMHLLRRQRLSQDHGEAELARAQAALASGDLLTAQLWSSRAGRRFTRRRNEAWAALADLHRVRVDLVSALRAATAMRRPLLGVARRARRLADSLRRLGLHHDAETAQLLALRALVAAGNTPPAELPRGRAGAPLDARLLRHLTRAELCRAGGRPQAALTELREGLVTLQDHRSRFGSVDLQSGAAALGADLATTGLDIAWSSGSPRLVFGWSERFRAQTFRIRSVLPPQDPQIADALAELRQVRRAVREAELAGQTVPVLRGRCADLERLIRRRGWSASGTGESRGASTYAMIRTELADADRAMVSFLVRRDRLHALVLAHGVVTLVELGDYQPVAEAVRRLLSDLDAAADTRLPDRLAAVVRASAERQATVLNRTLIAPVLPHAGDCDLVIVPTRQLAVVPWGLLPDLRGRPVVVAPSASVWRSARTNVTKPAATGPLLVAGPDLAHADAEINAIAALYPQGHLLRGADATAVATLARMDGAPVVHVAAHGHHDTQNVLFSRLELADGPLMAYELQRLATAPSQVVLSACDVGRAVVRVGDELVGFTAALLYAGTANVVASVARVPDALGPRVMARYHRAVADGAEPARALAALPDATPFVCFGAG